MNWRRGLSRIGIAAGVLWILGTSAWVVHSIREGRVPFYLGGPPQWDVILRVGGIALGIPLLGWAVGWAAWRAVAWIAAGFRDRDRGEAG
jgi:hypothetical protein